MKTSTTLIALFAVIMAAASAAKAEDIVDFDKGSFRSVDFMEAVNTFDVSKAVNAANITPISATALNTVNTTFYKLAAHGLQKLRKEVLGMPGLSKEFLQQLNEEKTVVLYNKDNVLLTTLVGDVQHIVFESNDRKLLEFLAKQKTEVSQIRLQNKGKVKVCKTILKTLWKYIKEVWVAYEISQEVCSWEDDGATDATPSTGNSGGSGSTYHNGQGGDSNYDVNKRIK